LDYERKLPSIFAWGYTIALAEGAAKVGGALEAIGEGDFGDRAPDMRGGERARALIETRRNMYFASVSFSKAYNLCK